MSAPSRGDPPNGRGGMSSRGGRGDRRGPDIGPDGKEINPYIPRFIANAPWYLEKTDDYLQHQRSTKEDIKGEWYDRGRDSDRQAPTKFRKGACTNCGAMTHKAKDCMERPRKVGAKYSGLDLRADDNVQSIRTTWDSKRDRWNGYDAEEYKSVVNEFEEEEQLQIAAEEEEKLRKIREGPSGDNLLDEGEDGEAKPDAPKVTTRTLRVREDKATYLTDLSEDSALFNPKSRTLRSEIDGSINDRGQFVRKLTDQAEDHDELRRFADLAAERGEEINLESSPTEGILKLRQMQQAESEAAKKLKESLLSKYGGEEYLNTKRPRELEEAPVEGYTEYTADGDVKKQKTKQETGKTKESKLDEDKDIFAISKYQEDVFPGNHSSVWGSYWKEDKWGFECCHSLIKQSYCLGKKGQDINGQPKNAIFTGEEV